MPRNSSGRRKSWIPLLILGGGCLGLVTAKRQVAMPLVRPLQQVLPSEMLGVRGRDLELPAQERKVSGVTDYVLRTFDGDSGAAKFSIYVGYYPYQEQGKSIHSPKNCLPGAGWEPLSAERVRLEAGGYHFPVNRYVIAKGSSQAVVYYWYQGRGRIAANEYGVKWEQIRDRALFGRSDEALVRVVVLATDKVSLAKADSMAIQVSRSIVAPVFSALPNLAARPQPTFKPI